MGKRASFKLQVLVGILAFVSSSLIQAEFVVTEFAYPSLTTSRFIVTTQASHFVVKDKEHKKVRFWTAKWCSYCPAAKKGLEELRKEIGLEVEEKDCDVERIPQNLPQTIPLIEWNSTKDPTQILYSGWVSKEDLKAKLERDTPARP